MHREPSHRRRARYRGGAPAAQRSASSRCARVPG